MAARFFSGLPLFWILISAPLIAGPIDDPAASETTPWFSWEPTSSPARNAWRRARAFAARTPSRYRILYGNCAPDEAQLLLLGNTHTDFNHEKLYREYLEAHAREGDLLLVEGDPAAFVHGILIWRLAIEKKLQIAGWDDVEAWEELGPIVSDLEVLQEAAEKEGWPWGPAEGAFLEKYREFERLNDRRDARMRETVPEAARTLVPGQRAFVLSGSLHLKGHSKLAAVLQPFRHIVAVPRKTRKPTREEAKAYFAPKDGKIVLTFCHTPILIDDPARKKE